MLIVMKARASEKDVERVVETIERLGYAAHPIAGANRTAVAVTGNSGSIDPANFENLPMVAEAVRVTKPYKLVSKNFQLEKSVVKIGNASIGGGELAIIAGPCAIENAEQTFTVAEAVASSGALFFRGGAFKPRTSPYAFQGMGEDGLKILAEVRQRYGLNIVTEAMDEAGVDLVEKYGDCIQIGARNMQNFSLLKYVGQTRKPVLLKRGLSATLDELLLAAEYIMSEGNADVILAERGIRTFSNHARNTLDLSIVPAIQSASHLPVIVDPSHGTGKNYMVSPLARAAAAVGADGLIIEVHAQPENALCDGAQALTPIQYLELVREVKAISAALSPAPNKIAQATNQTVN